MLLSLSLWKLYKHAGFVGPDNILRSEGLLLCVTCWRGPCSRGSGVLQFGI